MKQMSMRQQRVAEQLREALGVTLSRGGFKSTLIDGMITLPYVWISPDLRNARVYFNTLNKLDMESLREIGKALNAEAFRFQQELASFNRKSTPKLKFIIDSDLERVDGIEAAFSRVRTDQTEATS